MQCDACGGETDTLGFKEISGERKMVCPDCKKWKGAVPAKSAEPLKKGLLK